MRAHLIGGQFDGNRIETHYDPPAPEFLHVWRCDDCKQLHCIATEDIGDGVEPPRDNTMYMFLRQETDVVHYILPGIESGPWRSVADETGVDRRLTRDIKKIDREREPVPV